jgi:NADH-quinone oxidoreductase subunit N
MNLSLILPEIALFGGALLILMMDVFLSKKFKNFFYVSHFLALIFCGLALFLITNNFVKTDLAFNQMFASNSFTSFVKAITVLLLTIVILLSLGFVSSIKKISAEFLALLMIATTGAMVLISANDFLVFYLGLELQALPLYLLAALNRNSAKSSEAGLKYFILGCLASGILLFGISMIYGFSGTTNFSALMQLYYSNTGVAPSIPVGVMFGFVLVITAMFFKISAAPFHMWTPDVYEGSASIVATFFATAAKFTTIMALLNLMIKVALGWNGIGKIFIFVALLSLVVGSFGAIFQKNLKRLLAYSSIGHVGFILLGLAAFNKQSLVACVLYAIIYAIISVGSFGFLLLMKSKSGNDNDKENEKTFAISSLSGLNKTNPIMAFCLAILMFSTAGIPPLAGFFSKFYILAGALQNGLIIPSIIAVLFSVISAYYYLRIVKIMYFDEPQNNMVLEDVGNVRMIIFLSAILNLVLIFFLSSLQASITNFFPL